MGRTSTQKYLFGITSFYRNVASEIEVVFAKANNIYQHLSTGLVLIKTWKMLLYLLLGTFEYAWLFIADIDLVEQGPKAFWILL